jgi:transcriptional regulator GlxA family with amidase domain
MLKARSPSEAALQFEGALIAMLPCIEPPDRSLHHLLRLMHDPMRDLVSIGALARELATSERTLRRRCHEAFGYGPKTLARILRFQRFLSLARKTSAATLAALAAQAGYSDQAHLCREARVLSGHAPSALLSLLDA